MQSDLLGAHSMGVRNVLLITGDPPNVGDYPDATAVFDVDSIGLTNVVSRLNHGLDIGGQAIGPPTSFHIGVAANPGALNLDEELRRFEYKVEAGAEFAVTQPVFDADELSTFLRRIADVRIPLNAGNRPLTMLTNNVSATTKATIRGFSWSVIQNGQPSNDPLMYRSAV